MSDTPIEQREAFLAAMEASVARRVARRDFIRTASGVALAATAGVVVAACSENSTISGEPLTPSPTTGNSPPPPPSGAVADVDVLNFALNLEYLEAEFYSFASFGTGLVAGDRGGAGVQGQVNAAGARQVAFTDPVVRQYAREIAQDEIAHVRFLRTALGSAAVAEPSIDISVGVNSAFSNAARSAGLVNATQTFDPYSTDEFFLLGAFIFEDLGVTAYKGASPLITNKTFLEAAAGILAVEAYHSGIIRTTLYNKGIAAPSLRTNADAISNARDSLDGASDLDQGITGTGDMTNIVPADGNAIAFSRTPGQVLNIAYLTRMATTSGGFFPQGVSGNIRQSAAN